LLSFAELLFGAADPVGTLSAFHSQCTSSVSAGGGWYAYRSLEGLRHNGDKT
jgi:hypothetical protein